MRNSLTSGDTSRCWDNALSLLSHRMRSQKELAACLQQKGYGQELIEKTINRLQELKLIDDRQFAVAWVRSHDTKSQRLLKLELKMKGISEEDLSTVDMVDDLQKAELLVCKKMHILDTADRQSRRKIYGYLQRRGFDYDVIMTVLDRFLPET